MTYDASEIKLSGTTIIVVYGPSEGHVGEVARFKTTSEGGNVAWGAFKECVAQQGGAIFLSHADGTAGYVVGTLGQIGSVG